MIIGIDSTLAKNEKGDCAVRAVAAATNSTYEIAHQYVEKVFKRKPRRGVKGFSGILKIREGLGFLNNTKYEEIKIGYKNLSVGDFLEQYKNGTYIIIVDDHTFTIKDGMIIGNPEDKENLEIKIQSVFKII